jgi:hypothetical protein
LSVLLGDEETNQTAEAIAWTGGQKRQIGLNTLQFTV